MAYLYALGILSVSGGTVYGLIRGVPIMFRNIRDRYRHEDDFLIVCKICDTRNWFHKVEVGRRLENPAPIATCGGCHVNLTGPYMEHPFVKRAERELAILREHNQIILDHLKELHKNVNNVQPQLEAHKSEGENEQPKKETALVPVVMFVPPKNQRGPQHFE